MQEALWRTAAFADAGADVLFIDALESREEMKAFCSTAQGIPKVLAPTGLFALLDTADQVCSLANDIDCEY